MKFWRTFDIEVIKFVEGRHEINFQIGDSFFQQFEDNHLVEKGNLTVRVKMNKGANLIEMDFHIQGSVRLTCDRSLEEYDQPLDIHETMIYKYGSEEAEINEDVIMITRDTPSVNVAQLIYEFILVNLPSKRIHPDYRNELDDEDFEGEGGIVYFDEGDSENDGLEEGSEEKTKEIDPRWASLKNLKNKE